MLIDVSFAPKCMIEYDADVKFPPSLRRIKNRPLKTIELYWTSTQKKLKNWNLK